MIKTIFLDMPESYKKMRKNTLSAFTIGELQNKITFQSMSERLENLDMFYEKWFKFFLSSKFPTA